MAASDVDSFAEWRGTVKAALSSIDQQLERIEQLRRENLASIKEQFDWLEQLRKEDLDRVHHQDQEQWETIEKIRTQLSICRDRCEKLSQSKCSLDDLVRAQKEVETAKTVAEAAKADLEKKADAAAITTLTEKVGNQKVIQAKQGVVVAFYGLIGGALFSLLLALFGHLIKALEK